MTNDAVDKYREQLASYEKRLAKWQAELENTYAASKRGKLLRTRCQDIRTEIDMLKSYIYRLEDTE